MTVIFFIGEARVSHALEVARQTQDRVSLLENDHSRLVGQVDSRYAAGQEFEDYMLNKAEEDWIEITGLFLAFLVDMWSFIWILRCEVYFKQSMFWSLF